MKLISPFITVCLLSNILYAQYKIPSSAFTGGGRPVSAANFRISSSSGQTLIGASQTATFKQQVGFWRQAQMLRLYVANPIANKTLPDGNRLQMQKLTGLKPVFAGNVGTLTFTANSSNTRLVEVSIVGSDTLRVLGKTNSADTVVTVTVSATDVDAVVASTSFRATVTGVTDVEQFALAPMEFAMSQNYPNPFNPSTTIRYSLPVFSKIKLDIYNTLGQHIVTLIDQEKEAGYYQVTWNAVVPSGVYFCRIEAVSKSRFQNRFIAIQKMLVIR